MWVTIEPGISSGFLPLKREIRKLFESAVVLHPRPSMCGKLSVESSCLFVLLLQMTRDVKNRTPWSSTTPLCLRISCEQSGSYRRPSWGRHLTPAGETWRGLWSRLSAQRLSVCPTCQIHFLRSDLSLLYGTVLDQPVTGKRAPQGFSKSSGPCLRHCTGFAQESSDKKFDLHWIGLQAGYLCHLALSTLHHDQQKHKSLLRTTLLSIFDINILFSKFHEFKNFGMV